MALVDFMNAGERREIGNEEEIVEKLPIISTARKRESM